MAKKLSHKDFTRKAITSLRENGYKGIHTVFSGFNELFREYFGEDPVEATRKLQQEGEIVVIPRKGGAILYLPEEAPSASGGMSQQKKKEKLSKITG